MKNSLPSPVARAAGGFNSQAEADEAFAMVADYLYRGFPRGHAMKYVAAWYNTTAEQLEVAYAASTAAPVLEPAAQASFTVLATKEVGAHEGHAIKVQLIADHVKNSFYVGSSSNGWWLTGFADRYFAGESAARGFYDSLNENSWDASRGYVAMRTEI